IGAWKDDPGCKAMGIGGMEGRPGAQSEGDRGMEGRPGAQPEGDRGMDGRPRTQGEGYRGMEGRPGAQREGQGTEQQPEVQVATDQVAGGAAREQPVELRAVKVQRSENQVPAMQSAVACKAAWPPTG